MISDGAHPVPSSAKTRASVPDDGGPAFPVVAENGLGHIADGLTKREYFAGLAMQGLLAGRTHYGDEDIGFKACRLADTLIAELAKDGDA